MNPLPATILVIFGGMGDLTWRKLAPAVFNLHLDGQLPEKFAIIGLDRVQVTGEEFKSRLRDGIHHFSRRKKTDEKAWQPLAQDLAYLSGDFAAVTTFKTLAKMLKAQETTWECPAAIVFYLATPPELVETIVKGLGAAGLAKSREHVRIVAEKPFGHDLASATQLNRMLTQVFDENQIYRIDHYLGKETVQNILAFRFANVLFEPIWNRRYIDHVQISVAEQVGVEHRGSYYDHAGALRDMIQNHLLQLLCLVTMEPMVSFDADEVRNKKVDVLRAIRSIRNEQVHDFAVRGQYDRGQIDGKNVPAYRKEPNVAPDSPAETFAAIKLFVDNWRWQDVPFYLRTGKRLQTRESFITIQFRPVPHQSFPSTAAVAWQPNRLFICIQPNEQIILRFQAKHPGSSFLLSPVDMHFSYQEMFKAASPEAYETLLVDVFAGDATLFMRADQIEQAWSVITPILNAWNESRPVNFPNYPAGSSGPQAADLLIAQDGRSWISPSIPQPE